jgi:hypothetical protein
MERAHDSTSTPLQPFSALFTPMNHDKNWATPYSPYGRFDGNYIRFKTAPLGLRCCRALDPTDHDELFQNGMTIPMLCNGNLVPFAATVVVTETRQVCCRHRGLAHPGDNASQDRSGAAWSAPEKHRPEPTGHPTGLLRRLCRSPRLGNMRNTLPA